MKRITQTLAFRLFLLIASLQTVILVSLALAMIHVQRHSMMDNVLVNAERVSDLIVRFTRHSMLLNRKEDVNQIMLAVGREPGFEGVRLYNKEGQAAIPTLRGDSDGNDRGRTDLASPGGSPSTCGDRHRRC